MKKYSYIFLVLWMLLTLPQAARAASLSVMPNSVSVMRGDIVRVSILLDAEDQSINSASATLHFPTDYLQVSSISTASSIFSLWVEQPSFSNDAGEVTFDGGLPNPGYSGSHGTILTIVFVAKKTGNATLAFTDASTLANDGLGTNVLTASNGASVAIEAPPASDSAPAPASTPGSASATHPAPAVSSGTASGLLAPAVTSPTHPDQNAWYATTTAAFAWSLPESVDAVQTLVSATQGKTPVVLLKGRVTERSIDDLTDGTWYLTVRYKSNGAWSDIGSYRVRVDTAPPVITNATFAYDPDQHVLVMHVAANDAGAGVVRYEVAIDSGTEISLPAAAFVDGSYRVPYAIAGTHTITLRVVDAAGNATMTQDSFVVPRSVFDQSMLRVGSFDITFKMLVIGLILLSILSLAIAIESRYRLHLYKSGHVPLDKNVKRAIHRGVNLFRDEIEKSFTDIESARSVRELKAREKELKEKVSSDVEDLEKYFDESIDQSR